jgi:UDP-2-acetamido-2-deoxy-ribo-hexuluronate aminotransferase
MTGWDREYLENKEEYLKLFDSSMQKEQERNIEFLEKKLKELTGRKFAVACSSGTDALTFSLLSLDLKPDDEVLVTNFSWISSASCVSLAGATPVFCDVDLDTYHISFDSILNMVSDKTKAIVYPFLFGSISDTTEIQAFCKENGIVFIEDACQGLGSSLNRKMAGSIGDISTLSFNANKQIAGIAGGGCVLTDNKEEAVLFRKLRKHGEHEVLGYNSKMLGMNADFINFRLTKMDKWNFQRQVIAEKYNEELKNVNDIIIINEADGLDHTYHKYVVRFKSKEIRDSIKEKIEGSSIHYPRPISENPMYDNIVHRKDDCPNSKLISDTILTLPMHPYLTDEEISEVYNTIMIMA